LDPALTFEVGEAIERACGFLGNDARPAFQQACQRLAVSSYYLARLTRWPRIALIPIRV